jgi:hypothetical protein
MLPNAQPDPDRNTCWFCGERNPSVAIVCTICGAGTTPSHDGLKRIEYRIYSFGPRANDLSNCQKLHASKLQEAIQILQAGTERIAKRLLRIIRRTSHRAMINFMLQFRIMMRSPDQASIRLAFAEGGSVPHIVLLAVRSRAILPCREHCFHGVVDLLIQLFWVVRGTQLGPYHVV